MKLFVKSALCVAVAFAANASAAIQPLAADQFSVGGEVTAGGYYESEENSINTGATTFTVGTSYKNAGVVGYVEVDVNADFGEKELAQKNDEFSTDLDKAWIGYDFGFATLSYGLENDTALDKVDGAGDMTVEFGNSAPDASDKFNVVKFQGSTQGVAYGISYFENDADGLKEDRNDRGYNGYVGYEAGVVNVYVGYEKKRNSSTTKTNGDKVVSLSGNADLGVAKVGVNYWTKQVDGLNAAGNKTDKVTGYYVSAAKSFGELTLAAGYGDTNQKEVLKNGAIDTQEDKGFFNVSAEYNFSANTYVVADVKFGKEDSNTDSGDRKNRQDVYLKAGYTF